VKEYIPNPSDEAFPMATQKSWRDRILRAALLVVLAHILVKFISLAQNHYLGRFFDETERDVFVATFKFIFLTIFLVGEESFGPVFLPAFMRFKEQDGEREAWRFASVMFNGYFVALVGIALVLIFMPSLATDICTQWGPENAAELSLAHRLIPLMAPGLVGMGLGSLTYLLLNSRESFFWAAAGDVVVKVGIVIGILSAGVLMKRTDMSPATGLALVMIGVAAGGTCKLLTHIVALGAERKRWRLTLRCKGVHLKYFAVLVLPMLVGIIFAKVRDVFNHLWILSEFKGLITANAFGKTIADSVHFLVPYAVSIALLPYFCMLAEGSNASKFAEILRNSTRAMLFVFVPLSLALVVVSFPLTRGFYEAGKFTAEHVRPTATANACYVLGLSFAAVESVLMQAFFSKRSVWTPAIIGMFCSSLSMALSFMGIKVLGVAPVYVVPVVACGFVLSRFVKVLLLGWLFNRVVPFIDLPAIRSSFFSVGAVGATSLCVALGCYGGIEWVLSNVSLAARVFGALGNVGYLAQSGAICALAACGVIAVSYVLRLEELGWLLSWGAEKYPQLNHPILQHLQTRFAAERERP